MHLPLTDRLARVPKIIILIMTLKILIIPWFGDWEMGKLSFRCFDERAEQFVGIRMPYEDC